jgi:tetratricopeptide (TPR) repeat protein
MKSENFKSGHFALKRPLLLIALLVGLSNTGFAQFKENVRQSYLCYNKARLAMAAGKMDSAATYMEQSIRLNNQNAMIRFEAWDIFVQAGRYSAALADINDFYRKKELPDNISFFFGSLDSATFAAAKTDKEIRLFIASYDSLKMEHRKLYGKPNPFEQLVTKCYYIDQFAREYTGSLWESGDTTKTASRIINYADKENIKAIGDYIKEHSLPASSDDPTVHKYALFMHWIRDTATYRNFPGWQTIHDSVLKNVYEGKYDVRLYVSILESQHFVFTTKASFGIFTRSAPTADNPQARKLHPEVDDIAHVDQRRKEWLQPTLYEEYLINGKELQLPAEYKRN